MTARTPVEFVDEDGQRVGNLVELDGIGGGLLGQHPMATSLPVAIASNQTDVPVSNTALGATTDAAVVTDAAGTISGKLRGLVKWAFERMPASLGQKLMAASLPVVIASDQSDVPANIGRDNEPLTLTYAAAVDPTTFIDKRRFAMIAIGPIPAACNGLTMTPLAASDAAGTGKAIPYFTDSAGTKTAFYGVAVATGEWWVIQAEIAPLPFFGLRFSGGGVTTTIPVYLMG